MKLFKLMEDVSFTSNLPLEEINEIDKGYSNKIKWWLVKFKGVASKYLDHYLYCRLFEYKNNFKQRREMPSKERMKIKVHLTSDITTYVSWKSIKSKTLPI